MNNNLENLSKFPYSYSSLSEESIFYIEQNNIKVPSVHARVHNTETEFLVDTGVSVNIISDNVFKDICIKSIVSSQNPEPLKMTLTGPSLKHFSVNLCFQQ